MATETTDAPGISDKDFVNMIYRALAAGCTDGECYQEEPGSQLTMQGLFDLESVADALRRAIKGERIELDEELPPYQGE